MNWCKKVPKGNIRERVPLLEFEPVFLLGGLDYIIRCFQWSTPHFSLVRVIFCLKFTSKLYQSTYVPGRVSLVQSILARTALGLYSNNMIR